MTTYKIDPLCDPRWADFVERHPQASVFYTAGWLEALRRTYDYEPVAYTTTPPGVELTNGIALCRVDSGITGRRMVSLPFSDHCAPLVERDEELDGLAHALEHDCAREGWKYIEIRPRTACAVPPAWLAAVQPYVLHSIDLRPTMDEIFRRLHKNSTQKKIERAQREELAHEEGRGKALLAKFYHLLLRTRRRQQLLPQPRDWFSNLVDCLGDRVRIRVASKDGRPIASILTLSFKDVLVYKYGCSDERFHNLGGMQLLLWNAIQEGKRSGARVFDLGRSDSDNDGLILFKDRWGATRSPLAYWRYSARPSRAIVRLPNAQWAKRIFAHLPDTLLIAAGKILYKHFG
jgi:CelD/BcsL family acetyltransferase involved in cellulose biosynthesis